MVLNLGGRSLKDTGLGSVRTRMLLTESFSHVGVEFFFSNFSLFSPFDPALAMGCDTRLQYCADLSKVCWDVL
jgi:hypothetical protein